MANWNHAKDSEVRTSLGEEPQEGEEASLELFEDIYVDKHNKEGFQTVSLNYGLFLSSGSSRLKAFLSHGDQKRR